MASWFGCKRLRRKRSDEGQNNPGQITDDADVQNIDGAPDAKSWLRMDDGEDSPDAEPLLDMDDGEPKPLPGQDDGEDSPLSWLQTDDAYPTTPMNKYQRQHTKGTRSLTDEVLEAGARNTARPKAARTCMLELQRREEERQAQGGNE